MFFVVWVFAEEAHHLGDGGFDGDVAGADDADAVHVAAGGVLAHLDGAGLALCDVEDDDAAADGVVEGVDEPGVGGGVAGAVGLDDGALQAGGVQHGVHHVGADAGEEFKDGHAGVEVLAHLQRLGGHGLEEAFLEGDVDAGLGQGRVVVGLEGVEVLGVDFGAAVAAVEVALEEDADLGDGDQPGGGYLEGADDVLAAVGAQHAQRQLAAGEDDGLAEVLEHEAQGRGGIGHGVGAVEDHEAVVVVVLALDDVGDVDPERGSHVAGVYDVVQRHRVDAVLAAFELRHGVVDAVEGKRMQRPVLVLHHADGAAGINNQYFVVSHAFNNGA